MGVCERPSLSWLPSSHGCTATPSPRLDNRIRPGVAPQVSNCAQPRGPHRWNYSHRTPNPIPALGDRVARRGTWADHARQALERTRDLEIARDSGLSFALHHCGRVGPQLLLREGCSSTITGVRTSDRGIFSPGP